MRQGSVNQPIKLTRKQFNTLSAKAKGYWWYMQAEWNTKLPRKCPFKAGTRSKKQWNLGIQLAVQDVQDNP